MFSELALNFLHVTEPDDPPNEYQSTVLAFAGWLDNKHLELEQPDSEGWWWYKENDRVYCYEVWAPALKCDIEFYITTGNEMDPYKVTDFKGKWIKAIELF